MNKGSTPFLRANFNFKTMAKKRKFILIGNEGQSFVIRIKNLLKVEKIEDKISFYMKDGTVYMFDYVDDSPALERLKNLLNE